MLGTSIDIVSALTAKPFKEKGKVVHRYTYRALTSEEIDSPIENSLQEKFDGSVERNIGAKKSVKDLEEFGTEDTPTYDLYEDNDEDSRFPYPPDIDL